MTNSQQGEASDPAMGADQPSLYEFLTRLVSNPDARAAFDADPHAVLDQAGLGGLSSADVLQATSLALDYAPIEVVEEYDRSLHSSVEKFAANSQLAAFNHLHSAQSDEQEVTELSMLNNAPAEPDFSNDGDIDAQMPTPQPTPEPAPQHPDVDMETNLQDSANLISVHDVANENLVGNAVGNTVGNTVGNSVESTEGIVNNTVNQVTETVNHGVDTGAGLAAGAGEEVADVLPETPELPGPADAGAAVEPELPVDDVPVVGEVAGNLPVDDVAGNLPAPSDLPVVGGPVGEPVEDVVNELPVDGIL